LTSSYHTGIPPFTFLRDQLTVTPAPPETPPDFSWRFGQCRRWDPEHEFLYLITNQRTDNVGFGCPSPRLTDRAEQGGQSTPSFPIPPAASSPAKAVTACDQQTGAVVLLVRHSFSAVRQEDVRAILSFIRKNEVHGLLLGGDALDLGCVSHWNKDLPGTKRKGELKSDRSAKEIDALSDADVDRLFHASLKEYANSLSCKRYSTQKTSHSPSLSATNLHDDYLLASATSSRLGLSKGNSP
jgi:hypothetical protein